MSLTLLAFMRAFPGALCYVSDEPDKDAWEIGRLSGPLPAGAHEWATRHNIKYVRRYAGYTLRWEKEPDAESKDLDWVMQLANLSLDRGAVGRRAFDFVNNLLTEAGYNRPLRAESAE